MKGMVVNMRKIAVDFIRISTIVFIYFFIIQCYNLVYAASNEQEIKNGEYIIKSAINEKYVFDIYNNLKTNGANLELWENNKGKNQHFNVSYLGNGEYSIIAVHSSKSIDVEGKSKQIRY